MEMNEHETFMAEAIRLATENVTNGGGPFGAVIVRNGEIVATGVNRVTPSYDPTAHAEVVAIRNACQKLQTFKLTDCDIYASCEPCPMCLSAIYWAGLRHIYYGGTQQDAADIDFDDHFIYQQIPLQPSERSIPATNIMRQQAQQPFDAWRNKEDKTPY